MFKTLVTKVAKDIWDNASKPAEPAEHSEPQPELASVPTAAAISEDPPAKTVAAPDEPLARRPDTDIEFPYYPGEGTACGSACRCRWDVQVRWSPADNANASFATWVTAGDGDVCPDCQERARQWQDVMVRVEPTD